MSAPINSADLEALVRAEVAKQLGLPGKRKPAGQGRTPSTGKALEVLRKIPGRTAGTVAGLLGVKLGTAELYLERLQRQGLVRCDAYGRWYPTGMEVTP